MLSKKAKQFQTELAKTRAASDKAKDDVITLVRSLVMTLKDHGCASTAYELERRLFVVDCENKRATDMLLADGGMETLLELLTAGGKE